LKNSEDVLIESYSQTMDYKAHGQKGNSPDWLLRPASFF